MAEEVTQTDANSQQVATATSTEATQVQQANPPAAESAAAQSESENRVPQSRFNEVIEQRNSERRLREMTEARIRDLEARVNQGQPQESVVEQQAKRLVASLKLAPEAAKEIAQSQYEIAKSERAQIEAQLRQSQFQNWQRQMADKHKDYQELQPQMEKVYMSLNQDGQRYATSSLDGLQYIYDKAKASVADDKARESFQNGASSAYETKMQKQAIAPGPGGSAATQTSKLTLKAIRDMDLKEYQKRLPEINKAIAEGKLVD